MKSRGAPDFPRAWLAGIVVGGVLVIASLRS